MDFTALLALFEPLSIGITLIVLGLLSRRLGEQTQAKPYYLGFYAAAILIAISTIAQLLDALLGVADNSALWVIIADGFPAAAVTIGVVFAWRYWSWLLAERD
jgi:hypothetical protein